MNKVTKLSLALVATSALLLSGCAGSDSSAGNTSGGSSTITHNGVTYNTIVSSKTNKIWLDRNLGATQVCTSASDSACFGDLYQWGREADGHEKTTSSTTSTLATNTTPAHALFINNSADWTTADTNGSLRSANWSAIDGSSICPRDFRVPTRVEFGAELGNGGINSETDAFTKLKLPKTKFRNKFNGNIINNSYYWSSDADVSQNAFNIDTSVTLSNAHRGYSFSVRCIKN